MRRLMWFALGFTIACILCVYLQIAHCFAVISGVCGVVFLLIKKKPCTVVSVIFLGLTVGMLWQWGYDLLYLQTAKNYNGKTVVTTVCVTDYSYETDYGVTVDGEISLDKKNYRVRAYLPAGKAFSPGDSFTGELRLVLTMPDSDRDKSYHAGKGIFLLAYGNENVSCVHLDSVPWRYFPAVLRKNIVEVLDKTFSGESLSFARALLLGDSSLLTYETDTAFKLSGIRHIIAVSGLHVSILFTFVYFLSGKRRVLTALLGIPVLVLIGAVAGFTPSVVRACVMQGLIVLSLLFKRENDPLTSLSFAVLVMLLANPLAITSVSLQLSVGCCVGIILCYRPLYNYLYRLLGNPAGNSLRGKICRWLSSSVAVSCSATLATTPLCALYFGTVSLVGVFTNLLTMFVVSFLFYGIILVCLLSTVWLWGAQMLAKAVCIPIHYVLFVAKAMAKPHFAALYTCNIFSVLFLVFAYILFFLFLLSKKKRPILLGGLVLGLLGLTLLLSWLTPKLDNFRVTVLNVGQGQAVLMQSGGENYLIDCGGDTPEHAADTVAAELLSQGIRELDGVILTHYDKDHAAGLMPLLTRISARCLYLPAIDDNAAIRQSLTEQYENQIIWISDNNIISLKHATLSLYAGQKNKDGNESCMCVLFQGENCDILLTGDRNISGEEALLKSVTLPDLEVLVVGHHGASSATGLPLLSATHPEVAIISVGENNTYGHPSKAVLRRLELFGCEILTTSQSGSILIRG